MTRVISLSILLSLACGCATATMTADGNGSDTPVASRRAGNGFVAGGVVGKSAHYKLIGTLSSGQATSSSAHFKQRSGVLGATQP